MKKPDWLKKKLSANKNSYSTQKTIDRYHLNTVCDGANCPNKGECYTEGTATFMALGSACTRECTFCAVPKDKLEIKLPDDQEPANIAAAAKALNLDYIVVTMVTRDDLDDGGAAHIVNIIQAIRDKCSKQTMIEVLTSDFQGELKQIKMIIDAGPDVFNHNMETIDRFYPQLRPQASYERSLKVLSHAKKGGDKLLTKSGFMVGLGESKTEIFSLMDDLRDANVDILTIGQYLAPSIRHYPVKQYVHPDVFDEYREKALEKGFLTCVSGPYVRSSYKASYAKKYASAEA